MTPAVSKTTRASRSVLFYIATLLALQTISLLGLVAFAAVNDFRRARAEAEQRATYAAQDAAGRIGRAVAGARSTVASEAALPTYAAVFADPSSCTVTSDGADVFARGAFQVLRADGSVACSSMRPAGGIDGPGYAGSSWLAEVSNATGSVVVGPVADPVTRQRALIIAAPIAHAGGAIVLSLDLTGLGAGLSKELGGGALPVGFRVTTDGSSEITQTAGSRDPSSQIYGDGRVEGLDWRVRAGISTSDAFADARNQLRERLLLAAAILLSLLGAGWSINRRIARPIRALAGAAEGAEGDLSARVPEDGPKELSHLGKRFNRMLRERAEERIDLVQVFSERRDGERRAVDRMKSAFLLAISHELRTPLTVVSGYASMLEDNLDALSDEERLEYAQRIGKGARRLEKLLVDILDIERLARGVLEPNRRPVQVRRLVDRILDVNDLAEEIDVRIAKGLVAQLDPGFLERIVENLVRNAVKHTPSGTSVWVKADRRDGELVLVVEDDGPGVPDDLKEDIFEVFRRGEGKEHTSGTGVGLALVTQFARVHGGRAWVEDRAGGGASFRVSFPDAGVDAQRIGRASKRTA